MSTNNPEPFPGKAILDPARSAFLIELVRGIIDPDGDKAATEYLFQVYGIQDPQTLEDLVGLVHGWDRYFDENPERRPIKDVGARRDIVADLLLDYYVLRDDCFSTVRQLVDYTLDIESLKLREECMNKLGFNCLEHQVNLERLIKALNYELRLGQPVWIDQRVQFIASKLFKVLYLFLDRDEILSIPDNRKFGSDLG